MTLGLTVVGVSAGALLLLVVLFRIESARGSRIFFPRLRTWLDTVVIWCSRRLSKLSLHVGTGAMRASVHYVVQKVLGFCISGLTRVEEHLSKLQLRNRRIAKIIRSEEEKNHLDAIAAYKEENSLTDEEKRKRRMH